MREIFDRIACLRTRSAKSRSWSKCAKFLDRANPYYPPMQSLYCVVCVLSTFVRKEYRPATIDHFAPPARPGPRRPDLHLARALGTGDWARERCDEEIYVPHLHTQLGSLESASVPPPAFPIVRGNAEAHGHSSSATRHSLSISSTQARGDTLSTSSLSSSSVGSMRARHANRQRGFLRSICRSWAFCSLSVSAPLITSRAHVQQHPSPPQSPVPSADVARGHRRVMTRGHMGMDGTWGVGRIARARFQPGQGATHSRRQSGAQEDR
jgi:hypothetical protein